jgi:acyl-coenzyme A synthetase/AMP-(fatty) acid ligase
MSNMTDYEAAHRDFRLEVPERFNFTLDVLERRATETPEKTALVAVASDGISHRSYGFGEMAARAHRAARMLQELGVAKGDRVFVQVPRIVEWYEVMLGCIELGAIPMPGTTLLMPHDIGFRISRAEASVAVTDSQGADRVDAVAGECPSLRHRLVIGEERDGWLRWESGVGDHPGTPAVVDPTAADDPLLIYFTSGTTGNPKMVLHTQASYGIGHEITARFWHDLGPDDLHWTVSDTGWAKAAWGKLFGQWRMGAAVFMWNVVGKPDLDRMLRLIGEHRVTSFCAPPTLYRAFVQMDLTGYDWSSLRHCTSAGEPLNPEVIDVWHEATGRYPYDGYGQTETVNVVANYPCLPIKPGSMGRPTPGFDVEIVDEDGAILERGTEGHIAIRVAPERPIGLFREYWKEPARTEEVFRNGWYLTGDRGYMDEDGYLWFVGRADDVILSSAYRIGPFEVESALLEHPAVAEAAVVGKPDPLRGEIVKAYVVLATGYEPSDELVAEIQEHAKQATAPYKYPREIEFLDELPKTVSGKIRRVELRARG